MKAGNLTSPSALHHTVSDFSKSWGGNMVRSASTHLCHRYLFGGHRSPLRGAEPRGWTAPDFCYYCYCQPKQQQHKWLSAAIFSLGLCQSFICSPSGTEVASRISCDIICVYICNEICVYICYKNMTPALAQSLEQSLPGAQVSDTCIGFHCFDIFPALIKAWSTVSLIIPFGCSELRMCFSQEQSWLSGRVPRAGAKGNTPTARKALDLLCEPAGILNEIHKI